MGASEKGHLEIVRELCKRGATVNAAKTTDGATALLFASQGGHLAVVQCLLKHGVNKSAVAFDGRNAYDCAGGANKVALRKLLKP